MKVRNLFSQRKILWALLFATLAILLLTAATAGAAPEQSCGFYHFVRRGQTLNMISMQYGVSVSELLRANPQIKNPNVIYAGTKIYIPCWGPPGHPGRPGTGGMCSQWHYVSYGQNLSQIARMYRVHSYRLMQANGLHNPDLIYAGTYLCIP
jgi:LysM repeat protein